MNMLPVPAGEAGSEKVEEYKAEFRESLDSMGVSREEVEIILHSLDLGRDDYKIPAIYKDPVSKYVLNRVAHDSSYPGFEKLQFTDENFTDVLIRECSFVSNLLKYPIFPYQKTSETTRVIEACTNESKASLTIFAPEGMPSGRYVRLLMAYITSKALANKWDFEDGKISFKEALKISLGDSLKEFFEKLNGKKLDYRPGYSASGLGAIKTQLERLCTTVIMYKERADFDEKSRIRGCNLSIISDYDFWFSPKHPDERSIFESYIKLSPEFFELVSKTLTPVNIRMYSVLQNPRAMDLFMLVTQTKYSHRKGKTFTWEELAGIFSKDIRESSRARQKAEIRRKLKPAIEELEKVWQEYKGETVGLSFIKEGLHMLPGSPSITPKYSQRQLDKDNKEVR